MTKINLHLEITKWRGVLPATLCLDSGAFAWFVYMYHLGDIFLLYEWYVGIIYTNPEFDLSFSYRQVQNCFYCVKLIGVQDVHPVQHCSSKFDIWHLSLFLYPQIEFGSDNHVPRIPARIHSWGKGYMFKFKFVSFHLIYTLIFMVYKKDTTDA